MTATKKFLCLCYYDAAKFKAWTPSEQAAVPAACAPHDSALRASGRLLLSTSLSEPDTACVIRPTDHGPSTSPGAYARTNEPVGALFIVDAPNMDDAVRIAALHPGAHLGQYFGGGIEVREFDYFEFGTAKGA